MKKSKNDKKNLKHVCKLVDKIGMYVIRIKHKLFFYKILINYKS